MTGQQAKQTRWEQYPTSSGWDGSFPSDPILWALATRRKKLARQLLERKKQLTWAEGSLYAPWTLGWSLSLLTQILDMAPEGEELACDRCFHLPDGHKVLVLGNLLMGAAAVGDLPAVELLLARGCSLGGEDFWIRRHQKNDGSSCLPEDWKQVIKQCHGFVNVYDFFTGKHSVHIHPMVPERCILTDIDDAMSVACRCGHMHIVRRLLVCPAAVQSLAFHRALAALACFGHPYAAAVEDLLGIPAAVFVWPSEVPVRETDFFLDCLRQHDFYGLPQEEIVIDMAAYMLEHPEERWVLPALPYAPTVRLHQALTAVLPGWLGRCPTGFDLRELVERIPAISAFVLDRDSVPETTREDRLLSIIDLIHVSPPKETLSSLAKALLRTIERKYPSGRVLALLQGENGEQAADYLRCRGAPEQHILLIRALLSEGKEENYALP